LFLFVGKIYGQRHDAWSFKSALALATRYAELFHLQAENYQHITFGEMNFSLHLNENGTMFLLDLGQFFHFVLI
jgi:hypothetical protein